MGNDREINKLNVERLHGLIEGVRDNPNQGKYRFRAKNEWISGGHSCTTIKNFWAGGCEDTSRRKAHVLEGDEPESLLGEDRGPNATEALLHALGACLNASFIYHATVQGVHVDRLEIELDGYIDLNGFLGLDEKVASQFQQIHVKFKVAADASKEKLKRLCELAKKRSPVFNSVTCPVPVHVVLEAVSAPAKAHAH